MPAPQSAPSSQSTHRCTEGRVRAAWGAVSHQQPNQATAPTLSSQRGITTQETLQSSASLKSRHVKARADWAQKGWPRWPRPAKKPNPEAPTAWPLGRPVMATVPGSQVGFRSSGESALINQGTGILSSTGWAARDAVSRLWKATAAGQMPSGSEKRDDAVLACRAGRAREPALAGDHPYVAESMQTAKPQRLHLSQASR